MQLKIIILSEVRERQIPHDMWNLKYDTNEPFYEAETESQTEQNGGCQEGGGGVEWEVGVIRCKLSCVQWINNKVLAQKTIFNSLLWY